MLNRVCYSNFYEFMYLTALHNNAINKDLWCIFKIFQYNATEQMAIGAFHFSSQNNTKEAMRMCKKHYKEGHIAAYNQTYIFNSKIVEGH